MRIPVQWQAAAGHKSTMGIPLGHRDRRDLSLPWPSLALAILRQRPSDIVSLFELTTCTTRIDQFACPRPSLRRPVTSKAGKPVQRRCPIVRTADAVDDWRRPSLHDVLALNAFDWLLVVQAMCTDQPSRTIIVVYYRRKSSRVPPLSHVCECSAEPGPQTSSISLSSDCFK
jgi:hypothetical protein